VTGLRRLLAVYAVAVSLLALAAGGRLLRPSADTHYLHMAQGWLRGQLSLPGRPPHRNDWGRVTTLELRDGTTVRGYPCRTTACAERQRTERKETWRTTHGEERAIARADIVRRSDTWYVTFPPGPALVLLPLVAIWGTAVWDVLITILLGAAIPVVLVSLLDRVRGTAQGRDREHLWAAAAWTLASPAAFVAANGSVWTTAHVVGALAITGMLALGWGARRPAAAAACLALAITTRPPAAAVGLVFLLHEWWRAGRSRGTLLRIAAPLVVAGGLLAWFNEARFDDPFEFGHRYLDVAWQPRIQEHGLFSLSYFLRNLHCMTVLLPSAEHDFRVSIHGLGLAVTTPWLLLAPWRRSATGHQAILWTCAGVAALPGLLYQNTGQVQFTYRFALDWLPYALVAMALAGHAGTRAFRLLVALASILGLFGAWAFGHAPERLFVPGLWPYAE
jgi:hypothetical protein